MISKRFQNLVRVYLRVFRPCTKGRVGGYPPSRIRACERLFLWTAAVAVTRIGWVEVGRLSVRIAWVSVGIGRGKIVDCTGCLAVRMLASVGYRVGSEIWEKKKDLDQPSKSSISLWRATRGSNPGPLVPETNALSTELVAHLIIAVIWTRIDEKQRAYVT